MRLRLHFKFRNCWILSISFINFSNNKSPQIFYCLEVWRTCWVVKKSNFLVQASTTLLLMHCGSQHYLTEKSILLHIDDALLVQEINHLASSHNLLLFVDNWQIVVLVFQKMRRSPTQIMRSSSCMPWVILFWKIFCVPVLLKAISTI